MEIKGFLQFETIINVFPLHLNTCVIMGLRPLYIFYYFNAGIDFRLLTILTLKGLIEFANISGITCCALVKFKCLHLIHI